MFALKPSYLAFINFNTKYLIDEPIDDKEVQSSIEVMDKNINSIESRLALKMQEMPSKNMNSYLMVSLFISRTLGAKTHCKLLVVIKKQPREKKYILRPDIKIYGLVCQEAGQDSLLIGKIKMANFAHKKGYSLITCYFLSNLTILIDNLRNIYVQDI